MHLVVCPGIHHPDLTRSFLAGLSSVAGDLEAQHTLLIFPAQYYPAYSGLHILRFLHERLSGDNPNTYLKVPVLFLGFSAGVVGAIAAAWSWHQLGGKVRALIALDGWGVPLAGEFAIHRVSHDRFTHWSSALLGSGEDSFYADPGVAHLELWRSPQRTQGWWITSGTSQTRMQTSAASFVTALLNRYDSIQ